MYQIVEIEDTVRVLPENFGNTLEDTLKKILAEKYESKLDRDLGAIVSITDVKTDGIGKVIPGDGAAFYNTTFKALSYRPEIQEIVDGEVIEVVEFGVFVRLGPLDGLVHVSQITDDYLNYDEKGSRFVGKESKKTISQGDSVRARVVTISLKKSKENKIGLTMRQLGLGKFGWINEADEKANAKPKETKADSKSKKKGAKKK
ncbi:MAG: DNA-directed RNA polymerase [archaeon]